MTLLAVATSSAQGSLAIAEKTASGLTLLQQTLWEKKAMHSELATQRLEEVLRASEKDLKSLTHIAAIVGPGSFTGIRVGINLARTLAYGLSLPIAPFNALAILAFKNLDVGQTGLVAMKAVQQFYYTAIYQKTDQGLVEILAPCSLSQDQLPAHLNNGIKSWIEGQSTEFSTHTEAADLIHYLSRHPAPFFSWKEIKPLYIRASEAEEKMRQGLLKPLI
ncbi:MAG: tRNA (adenosine(37)-N6)-threonylcarbamoyltransferase complex dimerization subunit type 1 TsaB [Bdellovibrionales bacterium]|nr:tRNA (adenosine(37)-N6)-threonylcarbamoyltransferase complex dimerization subunit type 1 TsaB [Bdellovibrionales bacterium]